MSNLPAHSETLHIRLRSTDREVITARATRAGLTVSDYMRRAALGTLVAAPTARTASTATVSKAELPPSVKGNTTKPKYLSFADGDDPA